MARFSCPKCGTHNEAQSTVGLVCRHCGHGAPTPPPMAPAQVAWGTQYGAPNMMVCPNCRVPAATQEKIATWALATGIALTAVTFCPLFLLFLLAKERTCVSCGIIRN